MSTHPLAIMDDEKKAEPDQEKGVQVQGVGGRYPPPVHTRFKPGKPGGPGRPRLTPEEIERRKNLKSFEEQIRNAMPRAAERLAELLDSDDESIAARAFQLARESYEFLESNKRPQTNRVTVTVERVEEAQRVLSQGEDNGEEQG